MKRHFALKTTLMMIVGWLLVGYGPFITSVWSEGSHKAMGHSPGVVAKSSGTMDPGSRVIYGTVEGLTETHIKVDSGEVGEFAPRYLEVEKRAGKEDDLEVGDRLKIVLGSQNLVQDYSKAEKQ
jgi:hypothetical protein